MLEQRLSSVFTWVMGGVVAVFVLLVWLTRRAEFALYRTFNLRSRHLLLICVTDFIVCVLAPVNLGVSAFLWVLPDDVSALTLEVVTLEVLVLEFLVALVVPWGYLLLRRFARIGALKGL